MTPEQGSVIFDSNSPRIYLRPITEDDVGQVYLSWLNNSEVIQFLETRHNRQTLEAIGKFVESVNVRKNEHLFAICLTENDRHIGNIKVGPVKPNHSLADVSLFIGEKDCWGKGIGTDAIKLISRHAILELGLRKLNAVVYAENIGSIRSFINAGYTQEGLRRKHYMLNGQLADLVEMGLCADEFKMDDKQ